MPRDAIAQIASYFCQSAEFGKSLRHRNIYDLKQKENSDNQ